MDPSTRDAIYCFDKVERLRLQLERAELTLRRQIKHVPEAEFSEYVTQTNAIAASYDERISKLRR